jgi:hypothetical protein
MRPVPADEQNPLTGDAAYDDLILWLASKEANALIGFKAAPAAVTQASTPRRSTDAARPPADGRH